MSQSSWSSSMMRTDGIEASVAMPEGDFRQELSTTVNRVTREPYKSSRVDDNSGQTL